MSIIKKFQLGLEKTSSFLNKNILDTLLNKKINEEVIDNLENVLLSSDIGTEVTNLLINKIKSSNISSEENSYKLLKFLANEIEIILKPKEKKLLQSNKNNLKVLLFLGVNGSGKTTTIGKIIKKIPNNKKILIGACDTFRAAAVDQLREWCSEERVDFYSGNINQDPASVAYGALIKAKNENYDYLIIDTAGRLSNNIDLLNQLIKIKNTLKKQIKIENIQSILVLDATNGSNMIKQVETFSISMNVSGLIITKIDGTAKGGALISIAKKYEIPIHFVGLGENVEDLQEFSAKNFSYSILGIE